MEIKDLKFIFKAFKTIILLLIRKWIEYKTFGSIIKSNIVRVILSNI